MQRFGISSGGGSADLDEFFEDWLEVDGAAEHEGIDSQAQLTSRSASGMADGGQCIRGKPILSSIGP